MSAVIEQRMPKPKWLRTRLPAGADYMRTRALMRTHRLATVCEEARCPNIGECWAKGHATVMIMGDICTRACAFCNVATGKPRPLDAGEPARVARAVKALELSHIVITSVDRDDLADGGAAHFAATIRAVRAACPNSSVEVLTPDFRNRPAALDKVLAARPDVFNHNLETVPALYPKIRPGARYYHSLRLLEEAKSISPEVFTKSGLMVGLGESSEEIAQVMDDMRCAGVDFITLGQYLRPSARHAPVARYAPPEEFDRLGQLARAKGFLMVASSPFTRSSYMAAEDFARLQTERRKKGVSK